MINVDRFLRFINSRGKVINNLILKLNYFPYLLFGKNYRKKKKLLRLNFNNNKNVLDYTNYAISNTEFYSKYDKLYSIAEFKTNISFIDKDIVLESYNSFLNINIDFSNYVFGTTGGTSGKPMKLYIPKNRYDYELSVVHDIWERHGWNFDTRGVIRNHKLNSDEIYRIKPLTKEIIFDAFRLDEKYVKELYEVLKKYNIKYIQAYPSSAYLFCKICKDLELDISFIACFLTSSEPVLNFQRHLIENVLGLNISSFYGHSEKLIIGGDCRESKNIHFENSYGYVELVDENGNEISEVGQVGELIATGFNNYGLMMIRFKTGDFAEFVSDKCDKCDKKGLIVKNIDGHRSKNMIYKADSTFTSTTALNLHGELYNKIDGLQYVQICKEKLTIKLIKNNLFTSEDHDGFKKHFENAMGKTTRVEIEYVSNLEILPNGKFPLLISNLT
tara:strand:- start:1938 stop:3272 length:1335 start_codon:yes stop_codon:yes gene_type:complete